MVVVFTPQITWHGGDGGKNAPLFGISLLPLPGPTDLLATAGNDHCVHLWRSSPNDGGVEHVVTLTKCDTCVNCVRFSPDGLFLVACGDAGAVVVWSVPMAKRGGGNGKHYWNLVSDEKELDVKVLRSGCEDIYDVNWSACSKRFGIASLCHKVAVFEDQSVTTEAEVTDSNPAVMSLDDSSNNGGWGGSGVWKNVVVLNDHRMMVQGVAFDPCNNYLVTQGSDRVVNVFMRKERKEVKKKGALKDNNSVMNSEEGSAASGATSGATSAAASASTTEVVAAPDDGGVNDSENAVGEGVVQSTGGAVHKFELVKGKNIKWRIIRDEGQELAERTGSDVIEESSGDTAVPKDKPKVERHNLYVDDSTQSFFRRLAWTPDGAYLITPAGLFQETEDSKPQFATHLFARHNFEKPVISLIDAELPSVVVRPCPAQFKVPDTKPTGADSCLSEESRPAHRSVFAVLTTRNVYVYDTHHAAPLVVCKNLHYAGLTDAAWSPDGRKLMVTSSDGYVTLLTFENGELGELTDAMVAAFAANAAKKIINVSHAPPPASSVIPPCPPGQSVALEAPPAKKARRIEPTPVVTAAPAAKNERKRIAPEPVLDRISPSTVGTALSAVSLKTSDVDAGDENAASGDVNATHVLSGDAIKKKQKKRIKPVVVTKPLN